METAVIEISPGLRLLLGPAPLAPEPGRVALVFGLGWEGRGPTLHILAGEALPLEVRPLGPCVVLLATREAWRSLGGSEPGEAGERGWHLHQELRAIAVALRDCAMSGRALTVYRGAKGVELLCETIRLGEAARAVPLAGAGALSMADSARILAARRLIDERWSEPLSLAAIGRACGLNRAKLTRGFRGMFGCTVAEALAERRLGEARRLLLTTDLPVSRVGYQNGYLNNASFARAFSRRFGAPPSDYRAGRGRVAA